jgi:hypothetical protein
MELIFSKRAGKFDDLEIRHGDGRTEHVRCPKQRIIPHDMVHYAVETVLTHQGFLGRVAAGESATDRMSARPVAESVERLVEVIQAELWSGGAPSEEVLSLYELSCAERGHPVAAVTSEEVDLIRQEIADLTARWDTVPINGALILTLITPSVLQSGEIDS